MDSIDRWEDKLQLFLNLVKTGFDTIMPLKTVKIHLNDAPWITSELKEFIIPRQNSFAEGDTELFKHDYRNIVNRERKCCRSRFYAAKVENLRDSKPSQWWTNIKKIAGMVPSTGNQDLQFAPNYTLMELMESP